MFAKWLLRLLTVAILVATVGQVQAAPVYYTNRALFDAAAGGGLSFEGFEDPWTETGDVASFAGFNLRETGGSPNDLFSAAGGGTSFSVTEGDESIWYEDNESSIGVFDAFSSAVEAFGLDLTFNRGVSQATISTVTIGGSVSDSIVLTEDTPAFWGVIDTSGINSVDFAASGSGYLGFDAVSYGIPEPSALILLSIGAIGLLAYGWRRR